MPFQGDESTVDSGAATPAFLDRLHDPYFQAMDDLYGRWTAGWAGRGVGCARGQAVVMLRKKVSRMRRGDLDTGGPFHRQTRASAAAHPSARRLL